MQTYKFTETPSSKDIDAASALHLIPPGVCVYADRADYGARGGGANPAPREGNPKHWCYPDARWNFGNEGMWFVFLDGSDPVNALPPGSKTDNRVAGIGLTNRDTWANLSQPNFYQTRAAEIPIIPRFRYVYVTNEVAMRLSIGESPEENVASMPVAFLFEDPTGPIDWVAPDGRKGILPTGYRYRSTFPSDIGMRVRDGIVEAFRIAEYQPEPAKGQTFRSFSDAEQVQFLRATVNAPGNDAILSAKIRAFYER